MGEMRKEALPVEIPVYFPYCLHQSWAQNRSNQVFLKKDKAGTKVKQTK